MTRGPRASGCWLMGDCGRWLVNSESFGKTGDWVRDGILLAVELGAVGEGVAEDDGVCGGFVGVAVGAVDGGEGSGVSESLGPDGDGDGDGVCVGSVGSSLAVAVGSSGCGGVGSSHSPVRESSSQSSTWTVAPGRG